jgi:hypothetical protein
MSHYTVFNFDTWAAFTTVYYIKMNVLCLDVDVLLNVHKNRGY